MLSMPHSSLHHPPDLSTDRASWPGEPLIEMLDIVKTFKTPAGEFTALKKVSACFYRGEFVSVVGKSGSGKSTLVNMLTGIDHPTSGMVRAGGISLHELNESDMSLWRGRNLGVVFQFFQLLPTLSLLENVVLPMDLAGKFLAGEREARAESLLRLVGLEQHAHALPDAVSGGQQQSAAIARALANDPPVLVADEPTGNLDTHAAEAVFEIFKGLARQGKTIIMVTHDSSLASQTDRMMLLSDGELIHPQVAAAFPHLPHPRLLWLTHRLKSQRYTPGEEPALKSKQDAGLMLVVAGSLEISYNGIKSGKAVTLTPGQFFSTLDFEMEGEALPNLRAAGDEDLEVLVLETPDFNGWLESAPEEQNRLLKAVHERPARQGGDGGQQKGELL
jgi:putative ABC transport system ATP-binding protein